MLHQIARYSAVVPLIEELVGGTLLDVGSGSEGVASWLRPGWTTTAVDRSFEEPGAMRGPHPARPRMIAGDARALPFGDREFDAVLALDVIEHIAPADRLRVLDELVRVARRRLIVAGPAGGAALASDRRLAASLRDRGMPPPQWLAEHQENGFPEPRELSRELGSHGRLRVLGNENLRWHEWLFLFEFRRPGFHFSRVASDVLAGWIGSGPAVAAVGRLALRIVQGPARGPFYRTILVLDRG